MNEQTLIEKEKNDEVILSEVLQDTAKKIVSEDKVEEDEALTVAQAYLTSKSSTKILPKKLANWL